MPRTFSFSVSRVLRIELDVPDTISWEVIKILADQGFDTSVDLRKPIEGRHCVVATKDCPNIDNVDSDRALKEINALCQKS